MNNIYPFEQAMAPHPRRGRYLGRMGKQRFWNHSALAVLLAAPLSGAWAQAVPNPVERVESLVTFGAQSEKQWGDDDFSQTFFFLIPEK